VRALTLRVEWPDGRPTERVRVQPRAPCVTVTVGEGDPLEEVYLHGDDDETVMVLVRGDAAPDLWLDEGKE
jgi:hypothetical protein